MKRPIHSPAGATLYAIFRKRSDGTVWDNAANAWDTWLDGDIDDYDVALTDHGGDYYTVTVPSHANFTIDEGFYDMTIYKQAGGTPAITDLLVTSGTVIQQEDFHLADYFVDISPTPWEIQLRERNTATPIVKKTVKDTAGSDISDSTTVVGRLTHTT